MLILISILVLLVVYLLPATLVYREIKLFHEKLTYVSPSLDDVFSVVCPFVNIIVFAVYGMERLGKEYRAKNVNRKTFAEFFFRL